MGRLPKTKLPRYVNAFIRNGTPRYYLRKPGMPRATLPNDVLPWTPAFMAAYEAALNGQPVPVAGPVAKVLPRTFKALAALFYTTAKYTRANPKTQANMRTTIEWFAREHGDKTVAGMTRQDVRVIMDQQPTANTANERLKYLRALIACAIDHTWITADPTVGITKQKVKQGGRHAWTEAEIARYKARWPVGTAERDALTVLVCTGARREDVVALGRDNVVLVEHDGVVEPLLVYTQKKGEDIKDPVEVKLPILPELLAVIEAAGARPTLIADVAGNAYTPDTFGRWFARACDEAGLPEHCRAHGLRKALADRLANAGATTHELAAVGGWANLNMVELYTKKFNRAVGARNAMTKLMIANNVPGGCQNGETLN
jgi:integrase